MKLSASQRASMSKAAQHYHQYVAAAASYLEERGLWDEELVGTFLLGVVVDPAPGHEAYRGRLSIPYVTPSGVVNFRFRSLDGRGPKYLGPGAATNLFNVMALHQPGSLAVVCEGELDAVAATAAGLIAVGVPGAQAWKAHYARLLQEYERVIVAADGDEAGANLGAVVKSAIEHAEVRLMPDGHDVNSFLLERGEDAFYEWIAA